MVKHSLNSAKILRNKFLIMSWGIKTEGID